MQEKKPISHFVAGLVIAGLLIVISLTLQFLMSESAQQQGGWLSYLIIIGGLIFFVNQYGKAKNNQVRFGELFSYGFKATCLITLIFVLFLVVISYTYPEMKDKALEATRTQMEKKGATDAELEKGMTFMAKNFWALAIGGTILGFAIIGAIGSLIGAAVTKKEKTNPISSIDHLDQPQS